MLSRLPSVKLSPLHIANTQVIVDRDVWLQQLPQKMIIVELGVAEGVFSEKILNITNPQLLILVDLWRAERYKDKKSDVLKKFKNHENVKIIEGISYSVAKQFEDNYFDLVYIDTDHSYDTTLKELYAYKEKVKESGYIAGHDFETGNWLSGLKYGVKEAVYEFCVAENWEIIFLTMELNSPRSFVIRRILE